MQPSFNVASVSPNHSADTYLDKGHLMTNKTKMGLRKFDRFLNSTLKAVSVIGIFLIVGAVLAGSNGAIVGASLGFLADAFFA